MYAGILGFTRLASRFSFPDSFLGCFLVGFLVALTLENTALPLLPHLKIDTLPPTCTDNIAYRAFSYSHRLGLPEALEDMNETSFFLSYLTAYSPLTLWSLSHPQ